MPRLRTNKDKCVASVRTTIFIGLILALAGWPATGQTRNQAGVCAQSRRAPDCRVFLLTNFGTYFNLAPKGSASTSWRGMADWGVMVNADSNVAFGASWFVTLDEDDFTTGPAVHLRLWLTHSQSVELAIGTSVASNDDHRPGSLLGLIKYNPSRWVGLGIRPEAVRRPRSQDGTRVYMGVEFGDGVGRALTGVGAVALALAVVAIVTSFGSY